MALAERLVEVDPDLLRVGRINLYRDSCTRLHSSHVDKVNPALNCHVVRLAARDLHPKPNLEGEIASFLRRACGLFDR